MRLLFLPAALLLLASCGPADNYLKAKAKQAEITKELVKGPSQPGQLRVGPDGANGCHNRDEAEKLVIASKKDNKDEFIRLWGDGMKDQRCRGFTEGLGVTVTKTDAKGWPCIIPADDPDNKTCFWVEAGSIK